MNANPYQAPAESAQVGQPQLDGPAWMIILLCALVIFHAILSLVSAIVGLFTGTMIALVGGLISSVFFVAIFFGLWQRQEWARVSLICMSYVSIARYLLWLAGVAWVIVPIIALQIVTLVIAHNRRLKNMTLRNRVADPYV